METPSPLPPIVTVESQLLPRMLSADEVAVIGVEATRTAAPLGGAALGVRKALGDMVMTAADQAAEGCAN